MGIRAIVCVQKPHQHFLQTLHPLRMFKIVFRDSSLYPNQLSLFCLLRLISASANRIGYISNFCSVILLHEHKKAFFNIEAFRNLITPSQGKRKTKSLLDFYTVPSPRGALVVLAPPDKAPIPPKLKYETLHISGIFVKFECQAPLHERKASRTNVKPPFDHFLTTVLLLYIIKN